MTRGIAEGCAQPASSEAADPAVAIAAAVLAPSAMNSRRVCIGFMLPSAAREENHRFACFRFTNSQVYQGFGPSG